mmetsp:Transcript_21860/g.40804  ORF Transcript_21860/g.40804 Transcript_21860/m.40804 type:complete len:212 (+) Transcript_21860:3-638(+)
MMHFPETTGEKSFCITNENVQDCHIFSIGSNDQWGFESRVREQLPHCHTHTFDCTLDGPPKHKPQDDMVHFYPYCVSGATQDDSDNNQNNQNGSKRKYLSYNQLWETTLIQEPPTLLKMDVEGFEFDVLTAMFMEKFASSNTWPEQIMMEVHYITRMVDLDWMLRTRQAAELALFFDTLWNAGGYLPIKVQYFGTGCPSCMEILLLRVQCS